MADNLANFVPDYEDVEYGEQSHQYHQMGSVPGIADESKK